MVVEQKQSEQAKGWDPQLWEQANVVRLSFWDLVGIGVLCFILVATMPLWFPFWACQFVLGKVRRTR